MLAHRSTERKRPPSRLDLGRFRPTSSLTICQGLFSPRRRIGVLLQKGRGLSAKRPRSFSRRERGLFPRRPRSFHAETAVFFRQIHAPFRGVNKTSVKPSHCQQNVSALCIPSGPFPSHCTGRVIRENRLFFCQTVRKTYLCAAFVPVTLGAIAPPHGVWRSW